MSDIMPLCESMPLYESTPRRDASPCPSRTARRPVGHRGALLLLLAAVLALSSGDAMVEVSASADAAWSAEPLPAAVNFKIITPTAEELAALLAEPVSKAAELAVEPLPVSVPEETPLPARELVPEPVPVSAPEPMPESVPEPEPVSAAEPVPDTVAAREEDWMVFQGRSIRITPEAEWCGYEKGDFVWDGDRVRYIGDAYDAIFGIDVSAYHNEDHGQLDWAAAREDGVEFAIIRAGTRGSSAGKLYEDRYFAQNVTDAHAAGILTGAYFYSQAVSVEEAVEEAEFLLARMEGLPIDGPVCYDWEIPGRSSRAWNVSPETATAAAAAFCARIADAGYTPMIYESKEVGYLKYDQAVLDPYIRWYPQYPSRKTAHPYPEFRYHMELWQFSDRCTVAGVGKRTDGSLWLRPRTAE